MTPLPSPARARPAPGPPGCVGFPRHGRRDGAHRDRSRRPHDGGTRGRNRRSAPRAPSNVAGGVLTGAPPPGRPRGHDAHGRRGDNGRSRGRAPPGGGDRLARAGPGPGGAARVPGPRRAGRVLGSALACGLAPAILPQLRGQLGGIVVGLVTGPADTPGTLLRVMWAAAITIVMAPVVPAAMTLLYLDLRLRRGEPAPTA